MQSAAPDSTIEMAANSLSLNRYLADHPVFNLPMAFFQAKTFHAWATPRLTHETQERHWCTLTWNWRAGMHIATTDLF